MNISSPMDVEIEFMGESLLFNSNNFCRCCLTDAKSLLPMANCDQANGSTLQSLYDSICPPTTYPGGQAKICQACVSDLRMAFQFRQKCEAANTKLIELIPAKKDKQKKGKKFAVQPDKAQDGNGTFVPVRIKEEPVEHELFMTDSQIDDMPEVKMEKESTQINDQIVKEEIPAANDQLEEIQTASYASKDPVFCSFCFTSFANHKKLMQHYQKDGYPCKEVCNCNHIITRNSNKRQRELKFIWITDHKTLQLSSYAKYHRIFFPDCDFTTTDRRNYCHVFKYHLNKKHNTAYKEIYEYVVVHGLQRDLIEAGISQKPIKPHVKMVKQAKKVETYTAAVVTPVKPYISNFNKKRPKLFRNAAPYFTCHHCGLSFNIRRTLLQHFRVTPQKRSNIQMCRGTWKGFAMYDCETCGVKCGSKAAITLHLLTAHNEKYYDYQCSRYFSNCKFKNENYNHFSRHIASKHNVTVKQLSWRF